MSKQTEEEARQRVIDVLVRLGIVDSASTGQAAKQLGAGYFDDVDDAWEFEGSLGGAKACPGYFSFTRAQSGDGKKSSPRSLHQLRVLALAACQAALPMVDFKTFCEVPQDPQQFNNGQFPARP